MNPFTRFLLQWSADVPLGEFVARWDVLERVVVRVYKGKGPTAVDETEYQEARSWLKQHYPQFAPALRPYWQATKVGGSYEHEDPFALLLGVDTAVGFQQNWTAMQHLPAAREALNQFILTQTPESQP
jgi:hypothetical protein